MVSIEANAKLQVSLFQSKHCQECPAKGATIKKTAIDCPTCVSDGSPYKTYTSDSIDSTNCKDSGGDTCEFSKATIDAIFVEKKCDASTPASSDESSSSNSTVIAIVSAVVIAAVIVAGVVGFFIYRKKRAVKPEVPADVPQT